MVEGSEHGGKSKLSGCWLPQELAEKRIRIANKAIFDTESAIKAHEKFFLQIAALNSAN